MTHCFSHLSLFPELWTSSLALVTLNRSLVQPGVPRPTGIGRHGQRALRGGANGTGGG